MTTAEPAAAAEGGPPLVDGQVPSPCISVCRMNTGIGLCEGCFRTLDEIAQWGRLDGATRRTVWRAIAQRRASAPGAGTTNAFDRNAAGHADG